MKTLFLVTSLGFSASTFAHVSQTSGAMHQSEHLLWALVIIPVTWALMPVVEKLKQRLGKR
jgi:hypothetical protein